MVETLIIIPSFCDERYPTPCNTDIIRAVTNRPTREIWRYMYVCHREGDGRVTRLQTSRIKVRSSCVIWGWVYDYEVLAKVAYNNRLADLQRHFR